MQQLKLFLTTSLLALSLEANSCWNIKDNIKDDFSELNSSMIFSFKDAVNCKPLENVKVNFFGQSFTTDMNGEFEIPTPPSDLDMTVALKASKNGYMRLKQRVSAQIGTFSTVRFLMTEKIPLTQARAVLSWGKKPRDLDLHIKSEDFHISYRNKSGKQYKVSLDKDSTSGFGPETITINQLEDNKRYELFVNRYSSSGKIDNSVNLSVYANGKLDKSIQFPKTDSKCVKVASIYNGVVTYDVQNASNSECR